MTTDDPWWRSDRRLGGVLAGLEKNKRKKRRRKPARGRPRKPAGERRDHRLLLLFNAEEMAMVEAAASVAGKRASAWAREVLLLALGRVPGSRLPPV